MAPRRTKRLSVAAVAAATALTVVSCGGPTSVDQPDQPVSPVGQNFFPGDNFWNTPVPADAPVDPGSARYVDRLAGLNPVVSIRQFAVPVYVADGTSPRYRVAATADWAPAGFALDGVPIPAHATADPAEGEHLAILDNSTRCVYELYRAKQQGSDWSAEWINATPADGDGIYPDGLSSRASGFASTAGLIWPDELRSGNIPHALVFAYPFTRSGGPVAPATRTDGRSTAPDALPIGAHLVLDPALDLDTLGLGPAERTIAEALQRYGMVLGDTSGGLTLYAVHPRSFPADPYASTWGPVTWADLNKIPFDRMKLLPVRQQQPRYTGPPIWNRCSSPTPSR